MILNISIPDTREITLQKDFPLLSHAVTFYMKNGFMVTYNSAIKWKALQYCDWHRIFSHADVADQGEDLTSQEYSLNQKK